MKVQRKIIEIDEELCDGCGQCIPSCSEGALQIIDSKARLVSESYCDGLGACMGECPQGALRVVEREAEEFDEEAVEQYLESGLEASYPTTQDVPLACGCPSSTVRILDQGTKCETANVPVTFETQESRLGHWPVQINLVPVLAPFLKNSSLLVLADCTAVAYPNLHRDFLGGKAVMMGCPKFDDIDGYLEKFTEIFRTADVNQVTVLNMEVPCCSALPVIVGKAMKEAGKNIPFEEIMIGTDGGILSRS